MTLTSTATSARGLEYSILPLSGNSGSSDASPTLPRPAGHESDVEAEWEFPIQRVQIQTLTPWFMIRNEKGGGDLADTDGRDQLGLKHVVGLDEGVVGGPTCVRLAELVGGHLDVLL